MNYAKLFVCVYSHPRFIEAGFEASGYWMHALAYLRHQESEDGFLSDDVLSIPLSANRRQCKRLCERLVKAGLFARVEGGYVLLRYGQKNETKREIDAAKAAARQRKARMRGGGREEPRDASAPATEPPVEAPVTRPRHATPVSEPCDLICSPLFGSGSASGSDLPERDQKDPGGGPPEGGRSEANDAPVVSPAVPPTTEPAPARRPLPASERAVSGSFWLEAFSEGVSRQTGRPCTVGRVYLGTLERIVGHHAPDRSSAAACAWLRDQAAAFAAQWDGQHPPKGLTPDGLERWLNEGRSGPPTFGKKNLVQLPASEWRMDDYSDLGAEVWRPGDPSKGDPS